MTKPTPPFYPHMGRVPQLAPDVFVAPTCSVIGQVAIGARSSIWYGAVLRGDVMPIRIGEQTSIQDNTVVHATHDWQECSVGDRVTVGHSVVLHGCSIGNDVLIGMGSIILDAAEIGDWVVLGAGSLVTARTKIPAGVLAHGRPAKPIRDLTEVERGRIAESAALYVQYAREHVESLRA